MPGKVTGGSALAMAFWNNLSKHCHSLCSSWRNCFISAMDVGCTNVILFTRSEPQKAEMLIHYIYIYIATMIVNWSCWHGCSWCILTLYLHRHPTLCCFVCFFVCLFVFEWGGDGGSSSTVQNARNVALLNHKKSAELTSAKLFCNWGEWCCMLFDMDLWGVHPQIPSI